MTQLLPYVVAHTDGVLPADVAVDPDHVVWEPGPPEGEFPTTLVQRDLRTGRTVTLDRNVSPLGGLASSAEWVAYVTPTQPEHVVMVRHDGTDRRVIATAPIAPITGRGDLVAWAQEKNGRQQVVVLDTQSGRRWVAADVPACIGQRCYRIDWVTLADEGVVFDRGATGPQASYVVRRRFTDPRPEEVTLPDDPQPDLVPSSSGAFYNWFGHGWFRWDFGAQPVPAGVPDTARGLPLGFEDGTILLVRETTDCRFQLLALSGDGRTSVVSDPATPGVLLNQRPEDCFQLTAVATTSRQVLSGWISSRRATSRVTQTLASTAFSLPLDRSRNRRSSSRPRELSSILTSPLVPRLRGIAAAGLESTIIRPGMFASNALSWWATMLHRNDMSGAGWRWYGIVNWPQQLVSMLTARRKAVNSVSRRAHRCR